MFEYFTNLLLTEIGYVIPKLANMIAQHLRRVQHSDCDCDDSC